MARQWKQASLKFHRTSTSVISSSENNVNDMKNCFEQKLHNMEEEMPYSCMRDHVATVQCLKQRLPSFITYFCT